MGATINESSLNKVTCRPTMPRRGGETHFLDLSNDYLIFGKSLMPVNLSKVTCIRRTQCLVLRVKFCYKSS